MKRLLLLISALLLLLTGCRAGDTTPDMYIQPASLTEKEENIAKLLGADQGQMILDYKVDDTVQSMSVCTWELVDGEWAPFTVGGGMACNAAEGRIAIGFDLIPDGLRIAVQDENGYFASEHHSAEPMDTGTMGRATSRFSERAELEYGREVPLAVQIVTAKNEIRSFVPEYYFTPEEYVQYGYEHVYAITIAFSDQPVQ